MRIRSILAAVTIAGIACVAGWEYDRQNATGQAISQQAVKAENLPANAGIVSPKMADSDALWSAGRAEMEGGILTVMVPQTATAATLSLNAILTNFGQHKIICGETGYFLDCNITILEKNGRHVPYNEFGAGFFAPPDPDDEFGVRMHSQYGFITLQPGQARHWKFNLVDALNGIEPGEYTLSLDIDVFIHDVESGNYLNSIELATGNVPFVITK